MTYADYDFADSYNSSDTYDGAQPSRQMTLDEEGGLFSFDFVNIFPGADE